VTPQISVIMPCKGRAAQTVGVIPRLFGTAGNVAWELICVVDEDAEVVEALTAFNAMQRADGFPEVAIVELPERQGYWKALAHGSRVARGSLLANIANDVLPGLRWLERIVRTHERRYSDGMGVMGWNDGLLFDAHTGHLVIGRPLAERWYGEACWPTWYDHLYGDTEICQRAIQAEIYAVDLRAVLYHNHPVVGQSVDGVYRFSHTKIDADSEIFAQRRALQWPSA
jgi:hypothetical protein